MTNAAETSDDHHTSSDSIESSVYRFPSGDERSVDIDPVLADAASSRHAVRVKLPIGSEAWLVTTHADVDCLYRDKRFTRSGMNSESAPRTMRNVLLQSGSFGGAHGADLIKLRTATRKLLSRETVRTLYPQVVDLTGRLIDDLLTRRDCDLVSDLAEVVPMRVICQILGLPIDAEPEIRQYASHLLRSASVVEEGGHSGKPDTDDIREIGRVLLEALKNPQRRGAGLGRLIDDSGLNLTEGQVLTIGFGLIMAGFETTAIVLGKVLLRLASSSDEFDRLRRHGVTDQAVDEYLRLIAVSGGDGLPWRTATPCQFSGVDMKQDDYIVPAVGAANRDPQVFNDPLQVDLDRPNARRHLTFGSGDHFCLGSDLARMEIRVVLEAVCDRVQTISVRGRGPTWRTDHVLWALQTLPVTVTAKPGENHQR